MAVADGEERSPERGAAGAAVFRAGVDAEKGSKLLPLVLPLVLVSMGFRLAALFFA